MKTLAFILFAALASAQSLTISNANPAGFTLRVTTTVPNVGYNVVLFTLGRDPVEINTLSTQISIPPTRVEGYAYTGSKWYWLVLHGADPKTGYKGAGCVAEFTSAPNLTPASAKALLAHHEKGFKPPAALAGQLGACVRIK
jgi:hypothetical protein